MKRTAIAAFAAMAAILTMGVATPARADLEIQLSTDGSTWTTVATGTSGTSASYTNTFHGFQLNLLSDDSNSPGSFPLAYLEGSQLHITNKNSGTATLYIKLGDTGFASPTVPPGAILVDSQIGGSVTVKGSANLLTFQSYVDPANGQNSATGFTSGAQNPNITGTPKSYSSDASTTITSGLSSTYSITEYFKITLSASSQMGFQSSTDLSYTPEPSSMALAGLGALGLIGYGVRRRKARTA
jgi:hypothetical protein